MNQRKQRNRTYKHQCLKEDDEHIASPKLICKSCNERLAKDAELKMEYIAEQNRKEQRGRGIDAQLIVSLIFALAGYVALTVFTFLKCIPIF